MTGTFDRIYSVGMFASWLQLQGASDAIEVSVAGMETLVETPSRDTPGPVVDAFKASPDQVRNK